MGNSLAAGFQVVRGQDSIALLKNLWRIHQRGKIQSNRGLSETVERDSKDKKIIVSTCKRDNTKVIGMNHFWHCFLVLFVQIDEDSESRLDQRIVRYGKTRETALPTTTHSRSLARNPLVYPGHKKSLPPFTQAIPQTTAVCESFLPFREAQRILYGKA